MIGAREAVGHIRALHSGSTCFMRRARRCSTGNPMATFQDVVDLIAKAAGGQVKGADVGTILDANVGLDNQTEWRYSIVDLLKVLGLDSTLASRATLAQDLGYTGAPNGSVEMNIWL